MAISVNDGTAKWQLIKYSEADTLGGQSIQEVINNTKTVKCFVGTISFGGFHDFTGTIPLPVGYTREQCKYWCSNKQVNFSSYGNATVYPEDIDQSTGAIHVSEDSVNSGSGTGNLMYLLIAIK